MQCISSDAAVLMTGVFCGSTGVWIPHDLDWHSSALCGWHASIVQRDALGLMQRFPVHSCATDKGTGPAAEGLPERMAACPATPHAAPHASAREAGSGAKSCPTKATLCH